jgi:hypothetical protein
MLVGMFKTNVDYGVAENFFVYNLILQIKKSSEGS